MWFVEEEEEEQPAGRRARGKKAKAPTGQFYVVGLLVAARHAGGAVGQACVRHLMQSGVSIYTHKLQAHLLHTAPA